MKPDTPVAHHFALDVSTLFDEPLKDLGDEDPAFAGILTPASADRGATRGVTDQFLANAADYHRRYENVGHFRVLIDDALAVLDPAPKPKVILDVGSGAGNSVIPLLDRFPAAFVVATDISPQLLAILRDRVAERPEYRERCAVVCMDACDDPFRAAAFDLAVGAAVLHHTLEPVDVLKACEHALGPGGAAIFFEPFESGHALLDLAYRQILREAAHRGDTSRGLEVLRRLVADYDARRRDRSDPRFLELDDKWLFDRAYFEAIANRGRWADCRIYPIHDDVAPLTVQTRLHLNLIAEARTDLPAWAWKTLDDYEHAFSPRARHELVFEAAVVLRLAGRVLDPGSGWWWNPEEPGRGFFLEILGDRARVTCCTYADDGQPIWYSTTSEPATDGAALFWRQGGRDSGDTAADSREVDAHRGSLRFPTPRNAQIGIDSSTLALVPQRAENPGRIGWESHALTGQWVEDADAPRWRLVVEAHDERVVVALLSDSGWCIAEGSRIRAREYVGEWRRFQGGQALTGPYRRPRDPDEIGAARMLWVDTTCVLVTLPDGHRVAMRRLVL